MDCEIYLRKIEAKKVGATKSAPAALALAAQIDEPNAMVGEVSAVYAIGEGLLWDGHSFEPSKDLRGDESEQAISDILTRLFKVRLQGRSILQFSLVQQRAIGAPGRLFLRFVNTAVLYATGGISGLAGALTKTAVGSIFKTQDSWEDVFGQAQIVLDPDKLEEGPMTVELEISERTEDALRKRYCKDVDRPGSAVPGHEPSDEILEFIRKGGATANLTLEIRKL
jgi:hypothetical protein